MLKRWRRADTIDWLIDDFLGADLEKLPPGRLLDLRIEASLFAMPAPAETDDELPSVSWRHAPGRDCESVAIPGEGKLVIVREHVLDGYQSRIAEGLDHLFDGKEWALPSSPVQWTVTTTSMLLHGKELPGRGQDLHIRFEGVDLTEVFFVRAAQMIVDSWPLLRQCALQDCRKPFVARGRRLYHSTVCSNKARWGRYLEAHPARKK